MSDNNHQNLVELMKEMQKAGSTKKPLSGSAKNITLVILVFSFLVGVFGSFNMANFNMDSYVMFLEKFAWFFGPLVISIGVGTSTSKVAGVLKKNKEK